MVSDVIRIPAEAIRLLRIAAICLYGVFLLSLLPLFLPPALLDPNWQIQAINAIFSSAPFPLLASCFLMISGRGAAETDSVLKLRRRLRLGSRLASIGFVLLVPLLISCTWRLGLRAEIPPNRLIATLTAARSEILSSSSVNELNAALAKLPGNPKLPPNFNLPIPDFQKATAARLDQDLKLQKQQQQARIQARRLGDTILIIRNSLLAALFAVFFAAAGGVPIRRPQLPPLKQLLPTKAIGSLLPRRNPNRDYLEKLRQMSRKRQGSPLSRAFKRFLESIETGRRQRRARARAVKQQKNRS